MARTVLSRVTFRTAPDMLRGAIVVLCAATLIVAGPALPLI